MSKTVRINDRAPVEVFIGRLVRGPIGPIRMDDTVIGRILRSANAPKDMYAIGPNNKMVKLTLDNYSKSEEELFELQAKVDAKIAEDEAKAKADALRKSLEAKRNAEISKPEEIKSQTIETISEKETVENSAESKVQITETVENAESVAEEEVKDEEIVSIVEEKDNVKLTVNEDKVAEAPKNYNNYNKNNKNYNKNNKNRR